MYLLQQKLKYRYMKANAMMPEAFRTRRDGITRISCQKKAMPLEWKYA
jgi:hypothetical protein